MLGMQHMNTDSWVLSIKKDGIQNNKKYWRHCKRNSLYFVRKILNREDKTWGLMLWNRRLSLKGQPSPGLRLAAEKRPTSRLPLGERKGTCSERRRWLDPLPRRLGSPRDNRSSRVFPVQFLVAGISTYSTTHWVKIDGHSHHSIFSTPSHKDVETLIQS